MSARPFSDPHVFTDTTRWLHNSTNKSTGTVKPNTAINTKQRHSLERQRESQQLKHGHQHAPKQEPFIRRVVRSAWAAGRTIPCGVFAATMPVRPSGANRSYKHNDNNTNNELRQQRCEGLLSFLLPEKNSAGGEEFERAKKTKKDENNNCNNGKIKGLVGYPHTGDSKNRNNSCLKYSGDSIIHTSNNVCGDSNSKTVVNTAQCDNCFDDQSISTPCKFVSAGTKTNSTTNNNNCGNGFGSTYSYTCNARGLCHRDFASRHAQLLAEERETHRVALDRQQQRASRMQQRWRQECTAHTHTRCLLLHAQLEFCESREEAERYGITTAAIEERCQLQQQWIKILNLWAPSRRRSVGVPQYKRYTQEEEEKEEEEHELQRRKRRHHHKRRSCHGNSNNSTSNSAFTRWLPAALLSLRHQPFPPPPSLASTPDPVGSGTNATTNTNSTNSTRVDQMRMWNAHDSDLLRALQRAESHIAQLELRQCNHCSSSSCVSDVQQANAEPSPHSLPGVSESVLPNTNGTLQSTANGATLRNNDSSHKKSPIGSENSGGRDSSSTRPRYASLAPYIRVVYATP